MAIAGRIEHDYETKAMDDDDGWQTGLRGDGLRPFGPLRVLLKQRTPDIRRRAEGVYGRTKD